MNHNGNHAGRNAAIELHDSTVASILNENGGLTIQLAPAYVHRSQGIPGQSSGSGWLQEARLKLFEAEVTGSHPPLPHKLWDGSLKIGSQVYDNCLPDSFESNEPLEMELFFEDGSWIHVHAIGVRFDLIGEPDWIENFPGADLL